MAEPDFHPPETPTPLLLTERLRLEPLTAAHAPNYAVHFIDYEVVRHLSSAVPWPYPEDGLVTFLEQVEEGQGIKRWDWAICLKDDPGQAIGSVGLWWPGVPEHRGFWLGRAFWGNGYMHEATEATNAFAFEVLGYERLVFSNAVGNKRSRRIKERQGATFLKIEDAAFVDPAYTQSERWLLERSDWEQRRRG